jgi:hypothetical protein
MLKSIQMKKSFLFIVLSICFSIAFSQKKQPAIGNRHELSPLKAEVSAEILPAFASSAQPAYDSLVVYKFNSAIDSTLYTKRVYGYDDKSRRTDELWLKWDKTNLAWKNNIKIHYTYDDADRLTMEADYSYSDGKWIGFYKEEKAFDENGNQILYVFSQDWNDTLNDFIPMEKSVSTYTGDKLSAFTFYSWMESPNAGDWVPSSHSEYTYNENGDILSQINTIWSIENNSWINHYKGNATYDDQGRQTRVDFYYWVSDAWLQDSKNEIIYDGLSHVTTSFTYMSETDTWLPNHKTEYTNDEHNNVLNITDYVYYNESGGWILSSKYDYTYDDHQNKTSEMVALWNNNFNTWDMMTKWTKSFDDQNRELYSAQFEWDPVISDWKEVLVSEKTFDDKGNLVENINVDFKNATGGKVVYNYDSEGNPISYNSYSGNYDNWLLVYKGFYYRNEKVPTGESAFEAGSLLIYPNPAKDIIRISGIHSSAYITVYDLQGNIVLQRTIESDQLIPLNGLLNGMYVAKIKTAEGIFERKIVKSE